MFAPTWLYILLILLLLLVGIIFLYIVIRKARRSPAPQETELVAAEGGEKAEASEVSLYASGVGLRNSFSKAMRRIRAYGKGSHYRVPWYLMIGEAQSGKTTVLGNTGMEVVLDRPLEKAAGKQGVNWFFFDQGIVLDVAGDFVLRADGKTSNVKGWNNLAKQLRRHRPERPLDGIILTIPSSDLTGQATPSPEAKLRLEQKAQALYKKLVDAQKKLGLNFPVYVLVTKCDEVTGFRSLCHEIPGRRHEMFGWSSPYTREIAYRAEWVTEAFQNLHRYLFQLQIEVFAERDHVINSDDLFMLPSEMRAMRVLLQTYLNQIFKESAYHDPFFLRGIYFCGDSAGEVHASTTVVLNPTEPEIDWLIPPPNPSQVVTTAAQLTSTDGRRPAFLTHLFEKKIFQEEMLARPINRTALSRNRLVLAAQALSLVIPIIGVVGILLTYPALKEREREFHKFLTRDAEDLKGVKAEKESGVIEEQARYRQAHLFEALSNMSGKSLVNPFMPTSWFSYVNENSGNSISNSYQYVVFDSLRRRLDCRTESKLVPQDSSSSCYATLGTASDSVSQLNKCVFESDPSSNSVHTFIESLNELVQNRARYQRLLRDDSGYPEELNKLLAYFNHAPVHAQFDIQNSLFKQALRTTQRPALQTTDQGVYDRAACKVEGMIQEIYDRTFKDQKVTYGYLGDITKAEVLLSRPENAWLANRVFEYPSAFEGLTFAAGLSELKRALNDLSKEKFMSRDSEKPTGTQPEAEPEYSHQARTVLIWDTAPLQQAIDLYRDYANFVRNKTYDRLETLDYRVKQVALNDLRKKIAVLVAQAPRRQLSQRIPGESSQRASLRAEIKSFDEAQGLLAKLLDICRRLGIDVGLRSVVSNQTVSLMRAIDEEFYAAGFYAMTRADFSWWTSDVVFHSYTAFGASNPDELEVYLAVQRESIAELGRQYAAPVLNFMYSQNISIRRSGVDWKGILEQLDKYEAKKPGTTVAVLENFIRTEMDKVNLDNCPAILANSSAQMLDYFILVRNSLRQPFYRRCQQLAGEKIARDEFLLREKERLAREKREFEFYQNLRSYTDIQEVFNKTLAGRFPFSGLPQGEPFLEADPESINAFFQLLTKNKDAARSVLLQAPEYGISPHEALVFLEQMEAVQFFFASFLEKKPLYPVFDFSLRFRVNEQKEIGANQIIDWAFEVGQKRFRYQDPNTTGSWGYADPLVLSLRWANDSPAIPASKVSTLSHMRVEGKTVTVLYNNNWSLLLLLLKHKGTGKDFDQGVDLEPYTLKFVVPIEPSAVFPNKIQKAQPETLQTSFVEVFMRVRLMTPSKKDPLILPETFPTVAPSLAIRARTVIKVVQE
jgi:type VI secretion system protein ImpL